MQVFDIILMMRKKVLFVVIIVFVLLMISHFFLYSLFGVGLPELSPYRHRLTKNCVLVSGDSYHPPWFGLLYKYDESCQSNGLEKGLGGIPSSQKLKNLFCKDNDSGVEISYQEAIKIAQKDKCGLKGEELITFSEKYLCNENTGTWWVDLNVKPKREGCSPACVVDIVDKTAEVNWRCTGLRPPQ
jgi:hypothetical protein